ncbi:MAG: 50S ribosomal protein L29 [Patescibacteria group bacterium]
MEIKELRQKGEEELRKLIKIQREQLREIRFKVSTKQYKDVRELRAVRHGIARILTVLKEKTKVKEFQKQVKK